MFELPAVACSFEFSYLRELYKIHYSVDWLINKLIISLLKSKYIVYVTERGIYMNKNKYISSFKLFLKVTFCFTSGVVILP